jgi:hypothetical protein
MERQIHEQNLAHYRRLLAESDRNPERNEVQHNWLLTLLADDDASFSSQRDRRLESSGVVQRRDLEGTAPRCFL